MKPLTLLIYCLMALPLLATLWLAIHWYGFNQFSMSAAQLLLLSNGLVIVLALIALPALFYLDLRGKQP